jgi:ribosome-binding protein aMBF1 (putative translation factor)
MHLSDLHVSIGARIREARVRRRGMSQAELALCCRAHLCDAKIIDVQSWERGVGLEASVLVAVVEALDLRIAELFHGSG